MTNYPNSHQVIRTEMVRCGYTVSSLSEKTGISEPVLRGILNGRAEAISTRTVFSLARAFDLPFADFIDILSGALPYHTAPDSY